jgi:hypothetical protein
MGFTTLPEAELRENTWKLMRTLKHQSDKPWMCVGDFNEILHSWEKEGGVPKPQGQMDNFKKALEVCALDDLGYVGDTFTWRNNSHTKEKYIRERLDRAVATLSWRLRFPGFRVVNGDHRHSDHRPVIIDTNGADKKRRSPVRGQMSLFEARWLEEVDCRGIVENGWAREAGINNKGVMAAVKGVLGYLVDWSRNVLGDLEKRIKKIKKELEEWRRKEIGHEQVRKEEMLRFKLSRLEDQREIYWRQRAHAHWMKGGDRNTKYFHSYASERKKLNRITKLKKEDGGVVEEEEAMREVATNYFSKLLYFLYR